uniref:Uncharacterized protein n=1 Tax=Candidatus Kentrum sp. DK TaxID=2126562 RepID=A0A450RV56_9GAMM|nr:MAG: hypothetical protein BECKDK2373C_GA0170839_10035 [Candidatus Kentron sp. DK]VFJ45209.1 MAG: hypothetical protein BECKDK2373B_GA0170837_100927 [Candidatus Kentron sp. DK]
MPPFQGSLNRRLYFPRALPWAVWIAPRWGWHVPAALLVLDCAPLGLAFAGRFVTATYPVGGRGDSEPCLHGISVVRGLALPDGS